MNCINYFLAENWFNPNIFNPVELAGGMLVGIIFYIGVYVAWVKIRPR